MRTVRSRDNRPSPLASHFAPGDGSLSGEYQSWIQPEVAIRRESRRSRLMSLSNAEEGPGDDANLALERLVQTDLADRREVYLSRGRQYFKGGQYRESYDAFSLADVVSHDDPELRASAKMAMLYAAVASRQYALAIDALKWLLTPDPDTGELRDPLFLSRLEDISTWYGNDRDHIQHVRGIQNLTLTNPDSVQASALHTVVLWANKRNAGARSNALFQARRITARGTFAVHWHRLAGLMEAAANAPESDVQTEVAAPSSVRLPFELPEEEQLPAPR